MEGDEDDEWQPTGHTIPAPAAQTSAFAPAFVRLLGKQVLLNGSRVAAKTGRPEADEQGKSSILKHLDGEVIEGPRKRQSGKQIAQIHAPFPHWFACSGSFSCKACRRLDQEEAYSCRPARARTQSRRHRSTAYSTLRGLEASKTCAFFLDWL